jgi:hypothetical protein
MFNKIGPSFNNMSNVGDIYATLPLVVCMYNYKYKTYTCLYL